MFLIPCPTGRRSGRFGIPRGGASCGQGQPLEAMQELTVCLNFGAEVNLVCVWGMLETIDDIVAFFQKRNLQIFALAAIDPSHTLDHPGAQESR